MSMWVYLVQSLGAVLLAIILGHFVGGALHTTREDERSRR